MTQFKGGKHPCKWIFLTATNKMRLFLKLLDICLAVKKSLPPWSCWKCHFLPVIIDHLWISHTAAFEVKPVWYLLLKAQQAKLRFNDIRTIFSLSRDFKKKEKKKEKLMFQWLRVFLTIFPLVWWTDGWLARNRIIWRQRTHPRHSQKRSTIYIKVTTAIRYF